MDPDSPENNFFFHEKKLYSEKTEMVRLAGQKPGR
jgi:hypothetical protein